MIKNILLTFGLGLIVHITNAQMLFVEVRDFMNLETYNISSPEDIVIDTTQVLNKDTLAFIASIPNSKASIKGQYYIDDKKKKFKVGEWRFYYPDGSIQSIREYNIKGALVDIKALLDTNGDSLSVGFPHRNNDGSYFGHMYQYDLNGELNKVIRYSQGFVVDSFSKDKYPEKRLKFPVLNEYTISDTEVLTEYQFEEVVELLKTDPKPILIRATHTWNGYSKIMVRDRYSHPEIAKMIKDNFHFVYLDLGQRTNISFKHKGEMLTFEPDTNKKFKRHALAEKFLGVRITGAPTFIVLDSELKLIGTNSGFSKTNEIFIRQLRYYLDGHYQAMNYEEYSLPDDKFYPPKKRKR